jgi:hypothetical protein
MGRSLSALIRSPEKNFAFQTVHLPATVPDPLRTGRTRFIGGGYDDRTAKNGCGARGKITIHLFQYFLQLGFETICPVPLQGL